MRNATKSRPRSRYRFAPYVLAQSFSKDGPSSPVPCQPIALINGGTAFGRRRGDTVRAWFVLFGSFGLTRGPDQPGEAQATRTPMVGGWRVDGRSRRWGGSPRSGSCRLLSTSKVVLKRSALPSFPWALVRKLKGRSVRSLTGQERRWRDRSTRTLLFTLTASFQYTSSRPCFHRNSFRTMRWPGVSLP